MPFGFDQSSLGDPLLDQWQQLRQNLPDPYSYLPTYSAPLQRPDYGPPAVPLPDPAIEQQQRDQQARELAQQAKDADIAAGTDVPDLPPAQPFEPVTPEDQQVQGPTVLPGPEATTARPTSNRERVAQWDPQVQAASMKYGVPVNVIRAIMDMESNGDETAVSPQGAMSLMQVMCVDEDTEALTDRGWLRVDEIKSEDQFLTYNLDKGYLEWQRPILLNRYDYAEVWHLHNQTFDFVVTPYHSWIFQAPRWQKSLLQYRQDTASAFNKTPKNLLRAAPYNWPTTSIYSDALVAILGWVATDGWLPKAGRGVTVVQSKPEHIEKIRSLFTTEFPNHLERNHDNNARRWSICGEDGLKVRALLGPDKRLTPSLLSSLTKDQAEILLQALLDGDGTARKRKNPGGPIFYGADYDRMGDVQSLCMMLGKVFNIRVARRDGQYNPEHREFYSGTVSDRSSAYVPTIKVTKNLPRTSVWCPTLSNGTWVARRNGKISITGNSFHFQPGENGMDPTLNIDRGTKILADNYARYGDWNKAAAAYFGAIDGNGNVTSAQDATGTDGYAYVDKFRGLATTYDGQAAVQAPAREREPLTDTRPSQFSDPDLSWAEALAACGLAGAAAFVAVHGRTPKLSEVKAVAQAIGAWDQDVGMHGPDAEVRLVQALGGNARFAPGLDPQQIQQELASGNPVMVDSPGHYGVISGYDPSTGKFYFGTSATDLRGGEPWMTLEDYQGLRATGAIRGMLFTDNPVGGQPSAAMRVPGPTRLPTNWSPGQQTQQETPDQRQAREDMAAATTLAQRISESVQKQQDRDKLTFGNPMTGEPLTPTSDMVQPDPSPPAWLQHGADWLSTTAKGALDATERGAKNLFGVATPEQQQQANDIRQQHAEDAHTQQQAIDAKQQEVNNLPDGSLERHAAELDLQILQAQYDQEQHAFNPQGGMTDLQVITRAQAVANGADTPPATTDLNSAAHLQLLQTERSYVQRVIDLQSDQSQMVLNGRPIWQMTPDEYVQARKQNGLPDQPDAYARHATAVLIALQSGHADIPPQVLDAYGPGMNESWQKSRRIDALDPIQAVAMGGLLYQSDPIEGLKQVASNAPGIVAGAFLGIAKSFLGAMQSGADFEAEHPMAHLPGTASAADRAQQWRDLQSSVDQAIAANPRMQGQVGAKTDTPLSFIYDNGLRVDNVLQGILQMAPYMLLVGGSGAGITAGLGRLGYSEAGAALGGKVGGSALITGLSSYGDFYRQATAGGGDHKKLSTDEAIFYAGVHAVDQSAIELVMNHAIGKAWGATAGQTVPVKLASELLAKNTFLGALAHITKEAVGEGWEEGWQQWFENLGAKLSYDPNRDLSNGVMEAFNVATFSSAPHSIPGAWHEASQATQLAKAGLNEKLAEEITHKVTNVATADQVAQQHADRIQLEGEERGLDDRAIALQQARMAQYVYGLGVQTQLRQGPTDTSDPEIRKGILAIRMAAQLESTLSDTRQQRSEQELEKRQGFVEQALDERGYTGAEQQHGSATAQDLPAPEARPALQRAASTYSGGLPTESFTLGEHQFVGGEVMQPGTASLESMHAATTAELSDPDVGPYTVRGQAVLRRNGAVVGQRLTEEQLQALGERPYAKEHLWAAQKLLDGERGVPGLRGVIDQLAHQLWDGKTPDESSAQKPREGQVNELAAGATNVNASNDFNGTIAINPWHMHQAAVAAYRRIHGDDAEFDQNTFERLYADIFLEAVAHEAMHDWNTKTEAGLTKGQPSDHHGSNFEDLRQRFRAWVNTNQDTHKLMLLSATAGLHGILNTETEDGREFTADAVALRESGRGPRGQSNVQLRPGRTDAHRVGGGSFVSPTGRSEPPAGGGTAVRGEGVRRGESRPAGDAVAQGAAGLESEQPAGGERAVEQPAGPAAPEQQPAAEPATAAAPDRYNQYHGDITNANSLTQAVHDTLAHWFLGYTSGVRQGLPEGPLRGELFGNMRASANEVLTGLANRLGPVQAIRFMTEHQGAVLGKINPWVDSQALNADLKAVLKAAAHEALKPDQQTVDSLLARLQPAAPETPEATAAPRARAAPQARTTTTTTEAPRREPGQIQDEIENTEHVLSMTPAQAAEYGRRIRNEVIVEGDKQATAEARQQVLASIDQTMSDLRTVRLLKHPPRGDGEHADRLRELYVTDKEDRTSLFVRLGQIRKAFGVTKETPVIGSEDIREIREDGTEGPRVRVVYRQLADGDYNVVVNRLGVLQGTKDASSARVYRALGEMVGRLQRPQFRDEDGNPISMSEYLSRAIEFLGYDNSKAGSHQFLVDMEGLARKIAGEDSLAQNKAMAVLLQAQAMQAHAAIQAVKAAALEDAENGDTMASGRDPNGTYAGPKVKAALAEQLRMIEASAVSKALASRATQAARNLRLMQMAVERSMGLHRLQLLKDADEARANLASLVQKIIAELDAGRKQGNNVLLDLLQGYRTGEVTDEQLGQTSQGRLLQGFFAQGGSVGGFLDSLIEGDFGLFAEQAIQPVLGVQVLTKKTEQRLRDALAEQAATGTMPEVDERAIRDEFIRRFGNLERIRRDNQQTASGKTRSAETRAAYRAQGNNWWIELLNKKIDRKADNAIQLSQQRVDDLIDARDAAKAAGNAEDALRLIQALREEVAWSEAQGYRAGRRDQNKYLKRGGLIDDEAATISAMRADYQLRLGRLVRQEQALDDDRDYLQSWVDDLVKTTPGNPDEGGMTQDEIDAGLELLRDEIKQGNDVRGVVRDVRDSIQDEMLTELLPILTERLRVNHMFETASQMAWEERDLEARVVAHLGFREEGWLNQRVMQEAMAGQPLTRLEEHLRGVLKEHKFQTADEARGVEYQVRYLTSLEKEFDGTTDPDVQAMLELTREDIRNQIQALEVHDEPGRQQAQRLQQMWVGAVYGNGGKLVTAITNALTSPQYAIGGKIRAMAADIEGLQQPEIMTRLVGTSEEPGPLRRILADPYDEQADKDFQAMLPEIETFAKQGLGRAFTVALSDALEIEKMKLRISTLTDLVGKNPNDLMLRYLTEMELRGLHESVTDHEVDEWFHARYAGTEVALRSRYDRAVDRGIDRLTREAERDAEHGLQSATFNTLSRGMPGVRTAADRRAEAEGKLAPGTGKLSVSEMLIRRAEATEIRGLTQTIRDLHRMYWSATTPIEREGIQHEIERELVLLDSVGENTVAGSTERSKGRDAADKLRDELEQAEGNQLLRAMLRQQGWDQQAEIKTLTDRVSLLHEVLYGRTDGRKAKLTTKEANEFSDLRTRWSMNPDLLTAQEETALFSYFARGISLTAHEEAMLEEHFTDAMFDLASVGFTMANGVAESAGLLALQELGPKLTIKDQRWAARYEIAEAKNQIAWLARTLWTEPDPVVRQAFRKQIDGALGHMRSITGPSGDMGTQAADRTEELLDDLDIREIRKAEIRQDREELLEEARQLTAQVRGLHQLFMQGFGGPEEAEIKAELDDTLFDLAAVGATHPDAKLREIGKKAFDRVIVALGQREQKLQVTAADRLARRKAVDAVRDLREEVAPYLRTLLKDPSSIPARRELDRILADMRTISYTRMVEREVAVRDSRGRLLRYEQKLVPELVVYGQQQADRIADTLGLRTDTFENIVNAGASQSLEAQTAKAGIAGLRDKLHALQRASLQANSHGALRHEMETILQGLEQFGQLGKDAKQMESVRAQLKGMSRAQLLTNEQALARVSNFFKIITPNASPAEAAASVRRAMRAVSKPNWATYYREYGLASMLSSPASWGPFGVNVVGQLANTIIKPMVWGLRVGADIGAHKTLGTERAVFASEGGAALHALSDWQLWKDVAKDARQIWWHGHAQSDIEEAYVTGNLRGVRSEHIADQLDPDTSFQKSPVRWALSSLATWGNRGSFRMFKATDAFFGGLAWAAAYEAQVERKARQLKVTRDSIKQNIADYPDVFEKAGHIEQSLLLQEKNAVNRKVNAVLQWFTASNHPEDQKLYHQIADVILTTYVPFTTVPINQLSQSAAMSPLGVGYYGTRAISDIVTGKGKQAGAAKRLAQEQGLSLHDLALYDPHGKIVQQRALAESARLSDFASKAMFGVGVSAIAYALAMLGYLTGDDPPDPDDRAIDEAEHLPPRSVLVHGTWYSYDNTPVAVPFAMMANFHEHWTATYKKTMGASPTQASLPARAGTSAIAATGGTYGAVSHNFFLSNLFDLIGSLREDSHTTTERLLYAAATPLVTRNVPSMLAYMARNGDAWERDTRVQDSGNEWTNAGERLGNLAASRLPGLRQELNIRQDVRGQNIPNQQPTLVGLLHLKSQTPEFDPLFRVVQHYGLHLPQPPQQVSVQQRANGMFDLTLHEQRLWQRQFGLYVNEELARTGKDPSFNAVPPVSAYQNAAVVLAERQTTSLQAAIGRAQHRATEDVVATFGHDDNAINEEIEKRIAKARQTRALQTDVIP